MFFILKHIYFYFHNFCFLDFLYSLTSFLLWIWLTVNFIKQGSKKTCKIKWVCFLLIHNEQFIFKHARWNQNQTMNKKALACLLLICSCQSKESWRHKSTVEDRVAGKIVTYTCSVLANSHSQEQWFSTFLKCKPLVRFLIALLYNFNCATVMHFNVNICVFHCS